MNFRFKNIPVIKSEVLVFGAGGAGLRAAISAHQAGASVRLACKLPLLSGGSTAMGLSELMSIGAAIAHSDEQDSPEIHFLDTMRAGWGFIDEKLVRIYAEEVPARFWELVDLGVPFEKTNGRFRQRMSDFATYRRTMASSHGSTGRAITEVLAGELRRRNILVDEDVMLVDLLMNNGRITGALGCDRQGKLFRYDAGAVILATGGVSALYSKQVSTGEMTGDGMAAALRAGAQVVNIEFHQMGPSTIYPIQSGLSAPLYRLKPRLKNIYGQEFLRDYLPEGVSVEEALSKKVYPYTISNVSRYVDLAIFSEIQEGRCTSRGGIYYDFTHAANQFREGQCLHTYHRLKEAGVDLARQPVEVAVAFQCINGGVRMATFQAETTISGLFIAGEVAGGIRGPDRPGGNSLGECQVFGHRAGIAAAHRTKEAGKEKPDASVAAAVEERIARIVQQAGSVPPSHLMDKLRQAMGNHCMVIRHPDGILQALAAVEDIDEQARRSVRGEGEDLLAALELNNAILCARAILEACLRREESRSGHNRRDFPQTDDTRWRKSMVATLRNGALEWCDWHYPVTCKERL